MSKQEGFGNRFAKAVGIPEETADQVVDAAYRRNLDVPGVLDGYKADSTPEMPYLTAAAKIQASLSGIVPIKDEE